MDGIPGYPAGELLRDIKRLTSGDACILVADLLRTNRSEFVEYFNELGANPRPSLESDPTNWSMPEVEATMLYAIVRAVSPKTVLELGTHLGYSTKVILAGLKHQIDGRIVTLDHHQHLDPNSELVRSYRVLPLSIDGMEFSKTLCFPIDMIFEDGNHEEENTRVFLGNCLPHLKSGGIVVVHDVAYPGLSESVSKGMLTSLGDDIEKIVIDDAPCGLGLWVKP